MMAGAAKYTANQIIDNEPTDIKGFSYSRSTYIEGCSYSAKSQQGAAVLTDALITSYCGCVYDKGVAQYGAAEFTKKDMEATETNSLTPELNSLVNVCITQAMEAN
jgi:hypothetical protein